MKKFVVAVILAALSCSAYCAADAVQEQHQLIKVKSQADPEVLFERNEHPDAQWFKDAGLGLFVHWGISSVHGGIEISWGMIRNTPWDAAREGRNKVTPHEYFALADKFNPDNYAPEKWLEAAAKAGFKYAVLTTRHHDGYALWPSKFGQFNTRTHMNGRDLLEPFVRACRANALKVGFYYSPPDWYLEQDYLSFGYGSKGTPDSPHLGIHHEPREPAPKTEAFEQYYRSYVRAQVEELLTRYGKIDLLWFDGSVGAPETISVKRIRELQPGIVINNRQHGVGDFKTFEYVMPESKPEGWWEYCDSVTSTWGYTEPVVFRPVETVVKRYKEIRALGGNYLMNFAPQPDGQMPARYYEMMREFKQMTDME